MSIKNILKTTFYTGLTALTLTTCGRPQRTRFGTLIVEGTPIIVEKPCEGIPECYEKDGATENAIFGYGVASSQDIGAAERKAGDFATADLIKKYELYEQDVTNLLEEEAGIRRNSLIQMFSSSTLQGVGTRRDYATCKEEGEMHRVYIRLGMPIGVAADSLLSAMNRHSQAKVLQQQDVYKELKEQLDWYREYKERQQLR